MLSGTSLQLECNNRFPCIALADSADARSDKAGTSMQAHRTLNGHSYAMSFPIADLNSFNDGLETVSIRFLFAMFYCDKYLFDQYCLDATCLSISLSGREDGGFYTYRQLCKDLYKLYRRCSCPNDLPSEQIWSSILDLDLKTTTAPTVTEFISRSKLDPKLQVACKIRAERDKHDKKMRPSVWAKWLP